MSLRHRIDAAVLTHGGFKLASVSEAALAESLTETSQQLGAPTASNQMSPEEHEAAEHRVRQVLLRMGAPKEVVAPVTDAPQADPVIMQDVLQRARSTRDPADYLRLLSHDKDVNELARMASLPAMLLADAMTDRSREGGATREAVIDVLQNLQMPAQEPARGPNGPMFRGRVPYRDSAYPLWYPR